MEDKEKKITEQLNDIASEIFLPIKESRTIPSYSDIIYTISGKRFTEPEAKQLWDEILKHKQELNEKIGRDVGNKSSHS